MEQFFSKPGDGLSRRVTMVLGSRPHRGNLLKNDTTVLDKKYYPIINCLIEPQFRIVIALGELLLDSTTLDSMAKALLNVGMVTKTTLPLLFALLSDDVRRDSFKKGNSVLRGNTLATRLEMAYCKVIARDYIKQVLENFIVGIVQADTELDLQINPDKVADKAKLSHNQSTLTLLCQRVFNRIVEEKSIETMPREIRAIASFISDLTLQRMVREKLEPSNLTVLPLRIAGGLIFLRLFNPAITAPEKYGILPKTTVISGHTRANLVAISKVLQKLSNNVPFEEHSDPHALFLNPWLDKNRAKCYQYLRAVMSDPLTQQNGKPWEDIQTQRFSESTLSMFYHHLRTENMVTLHKIMWEHKPALTLSLLNNEQVTNEPGGGLFTVQAREADQRKTLLVSRRPDVLIVKEPITTGIERMDLRFLKELADLGPPPAENEVSREFPFPCDTRISNGLSMTTSLAGEMASLIDNEKFSDLSLVFDGRKVHFHLCILAARAPAFLAYVLEKKAEQEHNDSKDGVTTMATASTLSPQSQQSPTVLSSTPSSATAEPIMVSPIPVVHALHDHQDVLPFSMIDSNPSPSSISGANIADTTTITATTATAATPPPSPRSITPPLQHQQNTYPTSPTSSSHTITTTTSSSITPNMATANTSGTPPAATSTSTAQPSSSSAVVPPTTTPSPPSSSSEDPQQHITNTNINTNITMSPSHHHNLISKLSATSPAVSTVGGGGGMSTRVPRMAATSSAVGTRPTTVLGGSGSGVQIELTHRDVMMLLRWIYTGELDLSMCPKAYAKILMTVALRFKLFDMALVCLNAVYTAISVENVVPLLQYAKRINSESLVTRCLDFIRQHMKEITAQQDTMEDLTNATKPMMCAIAACWDPKVDLHAVAKEYMKQKERY